MILRTLMALAFAALVCLLGACAPSVGFNAKTDRRPAKPASAHVFVLDNRSPMPAGATVLGTITVKDAGFTVECGYDDVMRSAADQARAIGADAMKVVKVTKPDAWSSCWGVEALAVAFGDADTTGLREWVTISNEAFLAFVDASPCQDFGDPMRIKGEDMKVLRLPFLLMTRLEGATESLRYPLTEVQMNEYFSTVLKEKHPRTTMADTAADRGIAEFSRALLERAALGHGSPLQWGQPMGAGSVDSNAVIFFPLSIERRSGQVAEARVYLLVCDSRGAVVFSRCLKHRPAKWQSQIEDFKDELDGRIPLAD